MIAYAAIALVLAVLVFFELKLGHYRKGIDFEFTASSSWQPPASQEDAVNQLTEVACFQGSQEVLWKKFIIGAAVGAAVATFIFYLARRSRLKPWQTFLVITGSGAMGQLLMHNFYFAHGPILANCYQARRLRHFLLTTPTEDRPALSPPPG